MTAEQHINRLIRDIIAQAEDLDHSMSVTKYKMTCSLNGVTCSFQDKSFLAHLFAGLAHLNIDYVNHFFAALNQLKFLKPSADEHAAIMCEAMVEYGMLSDPNGIYTKLQDYVLKNDPTSKVGQKMLKFAYATGKTSIELPELVKIRRKVWALPKEQRIAF